MDCKVLTTPRYGTTESYSVLQSIAAKYYKVLLRTTNYHSVLQYPKVLLRTTKNHNYIQSITPYYQVLQSAILPHYSVW